jgi:5-hydroxyisourate hydrolase
VGSITTRVLDLAHGKPGGGMKVTLYRCASGGYEIVASAITNADGRCDAPLAESGSLRKGRYRLVFAAAAYFRASGVALTDPPFVDEIVVDFSISDAAAHYHVPLLVSPWSYSACRHS